MSEQDINCLYFCVAIGVAAVVGIIATIAIHFDDENVPLPACAFFGAICGILAGALWMLLLGALAFGAILYVICWLALRGFSKYKDWIVSLKSNQ